MFHVLFRIGRIPPPAQACAQRRWGDLVIVCLLWRSWPQTRVSGGGPRSACSNRTCSACHSHCYLLCLRVFMHVIPAPKRSVGHPSGSGTSEARTSSSPAAQTNIINTMIAVCLLLRRAQPLSSRCSGSRDSAQSRTDLCDEIWTIWAKTRPMLTISWPASGRHWRISDRVWPRPSTRFCPQSAMLAGVRHVLAKFAQHPSTFGPHRPTLVGSGAILGSSAPRAVVRQLLGPPQ